MMIKIQHFDDTYQGIRTRSERVIAAKGEGRREVAESIWGGVDWAPGGWTGDVLLAWVTERLMGSSVQAGM